MLRSKLFFTIFCFLSFNIYAGEQTGKISKIVVRGSDNLHYFFLEGSYTGKPTCSKNNYWIIKDENSAAGKTQISILLSSQAQQKSIRVVGTSLCNRWSDGEDVDSIFFQ